MKYYMAISRVSDHKITLPLHDGSWVDVPTGALLTPRELADMERDAFYIYGGLVVPCWCSHKQVATASDGCRYPTGAVSFFPEEARHHA